MRDYKNLVPCVMQTTHFASVSTKIRTVFNGAKSCCRVSIDGQISIRSAHVPQWYNARVVCGNPRFDTGVMHLFFVWPNVRSTLRQHYEANTHSGYAMTIWQVAGCCASWLCACLHQVHPAHTGEARAGPAVRVPSTLAALYAAVTTQHTQRACHDDVSQCWVLCVVSASGALCTHRRSPSRATRRCRCPIMISAGCTRCRRHQPAHTVGMP